MRSTGQNYLRRGIGCNEVYWEELFQERDRGNEVDWTELAQDRDRVCLVESESSRDTAEIGRLNDDGSEDHGLFQISDSIVAEEDTGATDAMSTATTPVTALSQITGSVVWWSVHLDRVQGSRIRSPAGPLELRTDDITKAARCAMTVFQKHGFLGWMGWKDHCQESLPDISCCFQGHSEF
uniref:lysozyme n=1 Tax=Timema monikensis TaxID=170555 RepID=A0A7R9E678_9NEOP|nr:unnamed protein product [Timema monikensis]